MDKVRPLEIFLFLSLSPFDSSAVRLALWEVLPFVWVTVFPPSYRSLLVVSVCRSCLCFATCSRTVETKDSSERRLWEGRSAYFFSFWNVIGISGVRSWTSVSDGWISSVLLFQCVVLCSHLSQPLCGLIFPSSDDQSLLSKDSEIVRSGIFGQHSFLLKFIDRGAQFADLEKRNLNVINDSFSTTFAR